MEIMTQTQKCGEGYREKELNIKVTVGLNSKVLLDYKESNG